MGALIALTKTSVPEEDTTREAKPGVNPPGALWVSTTGDPSLPSTHVRSEAGSAAHSIRLPPPNTTLTTTIDPSPATNLDSSELRQDGAAHRPGPLGVWPPRLGA